MYVKPKRKNVKQINKDWYQDSFEVSIVKVHYISLITHPSIFSLTKQKYVIWTVDKPIEKFNIPSRNSKETQKVLTKMSNMMYDTTCN